jgi:hypothetical protein
MAFGLDTFFSEQEASHEKVAAIREWLKREGTCLLLAPHHDVGFNSDLKQRQMEYRHHRDPLMPRQQRFGQYARSLMKGLDVPVHNIYGLRPATVQGSNDITPLTAFHGLDKLGLLKNVPSSIFIRIWRITSCWARTGKKYRCWRVSRSISSAPSLHRGRQ